VPQLADPADKAGQRPVSLHQGHRGRDTRRVGFVADRDEVRDRRRTRLFQDERDPRRHETAKLTTGPLSGKRVPALGARWSAG
jgi:hypothetical protein